MQSTNNGTFMKPDLNHQVPAAGGSNLASSGSDDPKMAWA
jgi:hypothetical protein